MPEKREPKLAQLANAKPLEMLVQVPGLLGALLMTRDGLPVVSQFGSLRRTETLAAMAAATIAASEVMAEEAGLRGPVMFQVVHADMIIAGMALSHDLMIVAFAKPDAPIQLAFERLQRAARE